MTSIPRDTLSRYMLENVGTAGLRTLREQLVAKGVPLDQLRVPGQRQPRMQSVPREFYNLVGSRLSDVPGDLAQAASRMFGKVAGADGVIHREDVAAELGADVARVFDLLVGSIGQKPGPSTDVSADTVRALPNALGSLLPPPNLEPVEITPAVMQRANAGAMAVMRTVNVRLFGRLQRALEARAERRDPYRLIAEAWNTSVEVPTMPALERLRTEAAGTKPLSGHKLLCVQHLYASTRAVLDAAVDAGVRAEDVTVLGKPYSGDFAVAGSMLRKGYNLVVPSLAQSEFADYESYTRDLVAEQITRLLAEDANGTEPILVLDDGGQISRVIREQFSEQRARFRIVEQTAHGMAEVGAVGMDDKVVDVAGCWCKIRGEYPSVAFSALKEMTAKIDKLEKEGVAVPRELALLGAGDVGLALAELLVDRGWTVHVYDPDAAARAETEQRFGDNPRLRVHADKREALASGHVVVGASGAISLDLDDYDQLPANAVLFSASSGNHELNAKDALTWQLMAGSWLQGTLRISGRAPSVPRHLFSAADTAVKDEKGDLWDMFAGRDVRLGDDRIVSENDRVVHLPNGKSLYFASSGFVVNLRHEPDPIPPRYIGPTRALLFAGLLQAARGEWGRIHEARQRQIWDDSQSALSATGESLERPRF